MFNPCEYRAIAPPEEFVSSMRLSPSWFSRVRVLTLMRNPLRRYYGQGDLHFVTFSCYRRRPLLGTARSRDCFLKILARVRSQRNFLLLGFVVMPEHVHLLLSEPPGSNPSIALQVLKQQVSRSLRKRRKRPPEGQLRLKFAEAQIEERHFWQRRFYDFNVWSEKKFKEKLEYMHGNPVKRRLVLHPKEWPWSSWRHYALGEQGLIRVDSMNERVVQRRNPDAGKKKSQIHLSASRVRDPPGRLTAEVFGGLECAVHEVDSQLLLEIPVPEVEGRLLTRTLPGSTTVKESCSRVPSFATASTTVAGLARRTRLGNLTKITPVDDRPRAYTNSPKSRSSVMSTRFAFTARLRTSSSAAPLATSEIAATSWPASRSARMTGPAQLSSARKFMFQDLPGIGASGSSTTSSWATLAAP